GRRQDLPEGPGRGQGLRPRNGRQQLPRPRQRRRAAAAEGERDSGGECERVSTHHVIATLAPASSPPATSATVPARTPRRPLVTVEAAPAGSNMFCEGSGVSVWKRLLQSKVGNWFRCGEFVSGARDESGTKREAPQAPLTALSEAPTPSLLPLTTPSRMNQIRPSPGEVTAMSRFWQHFLSNGS